MSEFSRTYDPRLLPGSTIELEAGEAERAALSTRFGLVRIDSMTARIDLEREAAGASAKVCRPDAGCSCCRGGDR